MTSDRYTYVSPLFRFSCDRKKIFVNSIPLWKRFCHSRSPEQPKAESFLQRPRGKEKTEPGNEAVFYRAIAPIIVLFHNLVDRRGTHS